VECLAHSGEVELLRRAGERPRLLLRGGPWGAGRVVHLFGPPLNTLSQALGVIRLVKDLSDVLLPAFGVVDERDFGGLSDSLEPGGDLPDSTGAPLPGTFPGWLTLLGRERVAAIGASRLLMAPVFLIDTLADGGLLIAALPLPREACARADRRSSARAAPPPGQGWRLEDAPVDPEELIVRT
jgi:hypothetical protein